MTQRAEVARGHDVIARWCALAEQRLEHLTELFETGRWRRYHSELSFLENIQEAKSAVETWRDLLHREASLDNSAINVSWLGRDRARDEALRSAVSRLPPQAAPVAVEPPVVSPEVESELFASDEAPYVSEMSEPELEVVPAALLDLDAIAQRYPLLHNAL